MSQFNARTLVLALAVALGTSVAGLPALAAAPVANESNADLPAQAVAQAPASPVSVRNVDFKRGADGSGILTLTFDSPAADAQMRNAGGNVIVDIDGATLSPDQKPVISVAEFATPANTITSVATGTGVQFVIDAKGSYKSMAYQSGNRFVVELSPEVAPPKAATSVLSAMQSQSQQRLARSAGPTYSGKPVTFHFQDVPVRTILQLIAEESGVNIVAADNVQGNVTLRLTGVPWDQALDLVLQTKGLDKRTNGKVIWVAPQEELARFEQDKEDARIALENRVDMHTEYVQINYHKATEILTALTEAKGIGGGGSNGNESSSGDNGFLSPRGRIVADARTNTLIISDIPKKLEQMRELIDTIDRPVDQVFIEARVVVANETFARELGARFGISGYGDGGRRYVNSSIENNISTQNSLVESYTDGTVPAVARGVASNLGVLNPAGSLALSILNAGLALDFELSAMQREGRGEVLSNPRLLTSNQREAVISQGREVGYVTLTPAAAGGVPTPNVQFKDVLLEMKVTPTITDDGRVFLDMNVKKDEVAGVLDTSIGEVPQISKRAVNTAVLIEDGQTVVIGGVYEFADRHDLSKVPFLGDIPFLGNLFKKRGKSKEKAELLIMVTPRVMRVAKPHQGRLPQ